MSFLVSKPAIVDPAMPAWVRRLQPLLSGVFTVDNLDYVRRDAYLTGVAVGPVDVERLRRYAFIGPDGLSLYEPGVGALEMFLTARFFMYRQVYFHRTVRAIDLDLGDVFADSVRGDRGRRLPGRRARDVRRPRRVRAAAPGGALGARRIAVGDAATGRWNGAPRRWATGWRAILLRRPRWRSEAEVRFDGDGPEVPADVLARLGSAEPGRVAIDQAVVDPLPSGASADLTILGRDGSPIPLADALARLPAYSIVARRFRRAS